MLAFNHNIFVVVVGGVVSAFLCISLFVFVCSLDVFVFVVVFLVLFYIVLIFLCCMLSVLWFV